VTEDWLKRRLTRSDAFLANKPRWVKLPSSTANPHRDNGKGHIVAPDEKLTAVLDLEWTIRG